VKRTSASNVKQINFELIRIIAGHEQRQNKYALSAAEQNSSWQAVQNKCIRMTILVCTYGVSMTRIFTLMKTKHAMITNQ